MPTITVQFDFETGPDFTGIDLSPGEEATFGRGSPSNRVDFPIAPDDRSVSRQAGVIHAGAEFWSITNTSRNKTYVVEHTDRSPGFIRVEPGMPRMPVPFETSWVRVPGGDRLHRFLVLAPEAAPDLYVERNEEPLTETAFRLSRRTTYFRVLVALCEPALRSPEHRVPPPRKQVARRTGLSVSGVNGQIDYLVRHKLNLTPPGQTGNGIDWRIPALVECALGFNLVVSEDLALLDT
jgi:hypothetical protein